MPTDERVLDLLVRWEDLRRQGQKVSPEDLCASCPELLAEVQNQIASLESMKGVLRPTAPSRETGTGDPASSNRGGFEFKVGDEAIRGYRLQERSAGEASERCGEREDRAVLRRP